jgi:hypothetical protein
VCSAYADAKCMKCSSCPVGSYRKGCNAYQAGICSKCSTKYELQQCNTLQDTESVSVYTSSGDLDQDNCAWLCIPSYYRFASMCRVCSTSTCNVGSYRGNCTSLTDGPCTSCTNLPENAYFESAGNPFDADNCTWMCNQGFYRANQSCLPCQRPAQCGLGKYLSVCTQDTNFACKHCNNKPEFANYIDGESCPFECEVGYFKNGNLCSQCSSTFDCGFGQRYINCTSSHDALCSNCLVGLQYAASSIGGVECRNCSDIICSENGTYAELCSPVNDAICVSCTNGPSNSYYDSPGSKAMNNCSWQCNEGYRKSEGTCLSCLAGTFSQRGSSVCMLCPAGTYSAKLAASSSSVCSLCGAGKYSPQAGAKSQITCQNCPVGFYQEQSGQSSCDPCIQNYYGVSTGASSRFECFACPQEYTTTRGSTGQAFQTSCICNENYYRIQNTTVQCQKCPPGLRCTGYSDIIPMINGSIWEWMQFDSNDYYRLKYCPENYQYTNLKTEISLDNVDLILLNQVCSPCVAGRECVQPPCEDCTGCKPGYYKACSGPTKCTPCLVNTYQPENGSFACQQCSPGTTTYGKIGSVSEDECRCDSTTYNLGQGCMTCPTGLQCFGNSTHIPLALEQGESKWSAEVEPYTGKLLLNLNFCPHGYFIAGTISTPGQLKCTPCAAGFECESPPCLGACTKCRAGFYKASTISHPTQVLGSTYDSVSETYVSEWIKEPCSACPEDTYRDREGGTEVGSCTKCPVRSNTRGMNGSTSVSDCKCSEYYYRGGISATLGLICSDCPQGAVCNSDRSCALGLLSTDSMKEGDIQSHLQCANPVDKVVGTWKRGASGEYNLIACPSGFTMQASNFTAAFSACILCPEGTYLLEEVTSTSTTCKPCPSGAACPGGNIVNPMSGFWKAPVTGSRREIASQAILYQCPPGFCSDKNECKNNRTGPVSSYSCITQKSTILTQLHFVCRCVGFVLKDGH